ncbi:28S ribosomal protein S23, mitochondrial [Trichoplax sp. H2]|uniref:Small ribosomal subunit protein mS23 n=1 Tax=Trichoplax adhaerens TaxID=10228 RepID=B3RJU9_TRIAD|nr:hypothetical protein TRIADDRAFT_52685 [Trichoplax adhaerens]EDV29125.1 hypothetical protein TRIADDRAFT_52685 [Trichoplax adhaerens]RDD43017.1 28S ribosomal protein S23, mitochondrial [Trichoplax sp. H2]|eukprot:XP_002108327.1 hypothetical protein TRIADDRAFT_52685 [Trichoplax adhaerens]
MASRNFKVGTVYTRVLGLLKSGAIKQKPLWFDIVETFPPILPTMHNRAPVPGRARKLQYWEDEVREKFYKEFKFIEPVNLYETDNKPTICDRFIMHYEQFSQEETDGDVAFAKSKEALEQEGVTFSRIKEKEEKEAVPVKENTASEDNASIENIFQL